MTKYPQYQREGKVDTKCASAKSRLFPSTYSPIEEQQNYYLRTNKRLRQSISLFICGQTTYDYVPLQNETSCNCLSKLNGTYTNAFQSTPNQSIDPRRLESQNNVSRPVFKITNKWNKNKKKLLTAIFIARLLFH